MPLRWEPFLWAAECPLLSPQGPGRPPASVPGCAWMEDTTHSQVSPAPHLPAICTEDAARRLQTQVQVPAGSRPGCRWLPPAPAAPPGATTSLPHAWRARKSPLSVPPPLCQQILPAPSSRFSAQAASLVQELSPGPGLGAGGAGPLSLAWDHIPECLPDLCGQLGGVWAGGGGLLEEGVSWSTGLPGAGSFLEQGPSGGRAYALVDRMGRGGR